jgi:autotransporter-associated beta strand protein
LIGGGTTGQISIVNPSNGNLTLSGLMTLSNNLTLSSNGSKRLALSGAITGDKTITIDNQAAIDETSTALTAITGNNTDFIGNVVIRAGHGTVLVNGNAFGSGAITLGAVDGTADAKMSAGNNVTVANAINVIGGNSVNHYLGNVGTGSTGATFTGLVTLGQGSSAPTNVIIDGLASSSGILTIAGGIAGHGDVQISSRGTSTAVHSISAGDGSKTINNVGLINMLAASTKNFTLSATIGSNVTGIVQNATAGGKLILSGANVNFAADTTINSGAIIINNDAALTKSTVNNDGGTVEYLVANPTFGGLKGDTDVATPTGTLSVGNNNSSNNFTGGLTGTGAVTKVGTGTQTLSGASSYTGATSVAAGTLLINGTNTATGNYGVAASAILGGSGTIAAAVSQNPNVAVAAGAKLAPGATAGTTGTLTFNLGTTGTLNLTGALGGSASMVFDLSAPGASDKIVVSGGTLTAANGSLNFNDFVFNAVGALTEGGQYTLIDTVSTNFTPLLDTTPLSLTGVIAPSWQGLLGTGDGGTDLVLTVSAVPEPASLGLLGIAAMGMLARRRRKQA